MTCPFTNEPCAIRDIGSGATVCPSMGLLLWRGYAVRLCHIPIGNPEFREVSSKSIAEQGAMCFMDKRHSLLGLSMCMYLPDKNRLGFCLTLRILDVDGCLLSCRLRVLQRSVRRWLRLRNERKFAVAMEAFKSKSSPLSVLPLDLFMANIASF